MSLSKASIKEQVSKFLQNPEEINLDFALKYCTENFLGYASHKIQDQAIPAIFDGLLPSQRGHILSLHDLGAASNKAYKKSTQIVSHQTSRYRPVGNTYDVLVNMSQSWRVQVLLTDPEGSWGGEETGEASAERYTEIRLSKFAEAVCIPDLPSRVPADKEPHGIVPVRINEFGTHYEERYIPTRLPLILINGSNGIAVGLAQTYQPLSYYPLLELMVSYISTGEFDTSKMSFGYPSKCQIAMSQQEALDVLMRGRGSIKTAGKYRFIKKGVHIVGVEFTSIPPNQTTNEIGDAFNAYRRANPDFPFDKFRNESPEGSTSLCFMLKQPRIDEASLADPIRALYQSCKLVSHQTVNMVALVDQFPKTFNLKTYLDLWIEERIRIIVRLKTVELAKLSAQIHRLELMEWFRQNSTEIVGYLQTKGITEEQVHAHLSSLFDRTYAPRHKFNSYSEEDTKALLSFTMRQLSRLSEESQDSSLTKKVEEHADLLDLTQSDSRQRAYLVSEITDILKASPSMGVRDIRCEFDTGLADFLSKQPSSRLNVAGFKGAPARPSSYYSELLGAPSPITTLVARTEKGLTFLVSNNSVRSTPFAVKVPNGDRLESIIHSMHTRQPFITGEGRIVPVDLQEDLGTNTPLTPNRILHSVKGKKSPQDITQVLPVAIMGDSKQGFAKGGFLIVVYAHESDGSLYVKKSSLDDLASSRSKINLEPLPRLKPRWAAITNLHYVPLIGSVGGKDYLDLSRIPVQSIKASRVPRIPVLMGEQDNCWPKTQGPQKVALNISEALYVSKVDYIEPAVIQQSAPAKKVGFPTASPPAQAAPAPKPFNPFAPKG